MNVDSTSIRSINIDSRLSLSWGNTLNTVFYSFRFNAMYGLKWSNFPNHKPEFVNHINIDNSKIFSIHRHGSQNRGVIRHSRLPIVIHPPYLKGDNLRHSSDIVKRVVSGHIDLS